MNFSIEINFSQTLRSQIPRFKSGKEEWFVFILKHDKKTNITTPRLVLQLLLKTRETIMVDMVKRFYIKRRSMDSTYHEVVSIWRNIKRSGSFAFNNVKN